MAPTNYDPTTPEHKRGVIKVLLFVFLVGGLGGGLLAYKIASVEEVSAQARVDGVELPVAIPSAAAPSASPR